MTAKSLTVKDFQARLEGDYYKGIGGARKSISRMADWSDAQKKKARGIAEAHFGVDEDAPAIKTKGKSVERRAAKTASKDEVKEAPKKRRKRRTKAEMAEARASEGTDAVVNIVGRDVTEDTSVIPQTGSQRDISRSMENMERILVGYKDTQSLGAPESALALSAKEAMLTLDILVAEIKALHTDAVQSLPPTAEEEGAIDAFAKAATAALASSGSNGVSSKAATLAAPIL